MYYARPHAICNCFGTDLVDITKALEVETAIRSATLPDGDTKQIISALLAVIDDARETNRSLLDIVSDPDPAEDECGKVAELYRQYLPMCRGVESLTQQRRRSMVARWRELQKGKPREKRQAFLEFWEAVFKHAAKSDFLTGRRPNDRGWKPTIDFFIQRTSLMKLREGAYHSDDTVPVGSLMSWI